MDLYNALNLSTIRSEPNLWISRVVILEKLDQPPIRDIPLTQGVNIVWAEESDDDDTTIEISGHSAGKTTFCRFLRYLLGETTFGTKANTELIRKTLPDGYIAAEIQVLGKSFAVRRPIGNGRLSYFKENSTIEELLAESPNGVSQLDYVSKLGLADIGNGMATRTVARTGERIEWEHILAWCARDQEARFQNIYDWRSPRSESESRAFQFPKAGPLFAMRALLGLLLPLELTSDADLSRLYSERDRLEKQIGKAEQEPAYWMTHHEAEVRRLVKLALPENSDVETVPVQGDGVLFTLPVIAEQAIELLKASRTASGTRLAVLQSQLDDLGAEIRQKDGTIEQLDALFGINSAANDELTADPDRAHRAKLKEIENLRCQFGGVLFRDCTHVKDRQSTIKISDLQDARLREQAEAKRVEEIKGQEDARAALVAEVAELRKRRDAVQKERDGLSSTVLEQEQQAQKLQESFDALQGWLVRKLAGQESDILIRLRAEAQRVTTQIGTLESDLVSAAQQHNQNLETLSTIFSRAVQSVLPSLSYDGQVSLDNRELAFRITHGSAMTGEAVETLSVLLADLSCVVFGSVSDSVHLPGFLLHDSPREADLGLRLYKNVIRLAVASAGHFGDVSQCPFQYVLTTTTPPPKELRGPEFVKLKLNAATLDELLLRRNISVPVPGQAALQLDETELNEPK